MEEGEPSVADSEAVVDSDERRGGFGSLGSIVFLLVLTWAAGIASFPLNDNSFFTHLATGRLILDEGRVPSTDPYTFTAQGEPWTVQSWLASVVYASAERLAGDLGLRALVLMVFLAAMTLLWRLTRPAESIFARFLIVAAACVIVSELWSERPYMIGVMGLAIVWLALEGAIRPWLLLPVMWIWVNTHGSFVLAPVLVGLYLGGAALDRRAAESSAPETPRGLARGLALAVLLGTLLGAIGPVGLKILWFPVTALSNSSSFAEIIEWRPPTYRSIDERAFLLLAVVGLVLVARSRRWRFMLPAAAFVAAGLYAQRNIVMATVVLVAVCARSVPAWGTLRSDSRPSVGRPAAVAVAALLVVVCLSTLLTPALPVGSLGGYPAHALQWVAQTGGDERIAGEASTGNLLEVLDGPTGTVFADDRVDMLPSEVFDAYLRLGRGQASWDAILDRYAIDVVIWKRDAPISSLLATDQRWAVVYSDSGAVVACRRSNGC